MHVVKIVVARTGPGIEKDPRTQSGPLLTHELSPTATQGGTSSGAGT